MTQEVAGAWEGGSGCVGVGGWGRWRRRWLVHGMEGVREGGEEGGPALPVCLWGAPQQPLEGYPNNLCLFLERLAGWQRKQGGGGRTSG